MSEIVELSSLDLRYEGHRLRDPAGEARLLTSIRERGIERPLQGVDPPARRLLLNGFKRCRAAKKLGIATVPYVSLGEEEATGILSLMRVSTAKPLGILEEARFLGDLLSIHGMSLAEVAETLSRSKGWVCMRQPLHDEVLPARGAFVLGLAARQCVIDNTNLARLRGSGYSAVIVAEMAAFAARYGFQFLWEQRLRGLGPEVAAYVDYALQTPGRGTWQRVGGTASSASCSPSAAR